MLYMRYIPTVFDQDYLQNWTFELKQSLNWTKANFHDIRCEVVITSSTDNKPLSK